MALLNYTSTYKDSLKNLQQALIFTGDGHIVTHGVDYAAEIVAMAKKNSDSVQKNLDDHIGDTVHITDSERAQWNEAKSAIDAFLNDKAVSDNVVDTLKEIQEYITTDGKDAAELVNSVFKTVKVGTNTISASNASNTLTILGLGISISNDNELVFSVATDTTGGLMSANDKKNLDLLYTKVDTEISGQIAGLKYFSTIGGINASGAGSSLAFSGSGFSVNDSTNPTEIIITNTTYSFEGGQNKFTVTPSIGKSQEIEISPYIQYNVTYSGLLTSGNVAIFDETNGKIKNSGFTINSNVPVDAKFTDTWREIRINNEPITSAINFVPGESTVILKNIDNTDTKDIVELSFDLRWYNLDLNEGKGDWEV